MLVLKPVGPKAARFLASTALFALIMGPVGSGKTITCCQKILRVGAVQPAVRRRDGIGVRHAKVIVVAKTYPVIDANLLPSWFQVVPETVGKFSWDAPRTHAFQRVLRRDRETGAISEILDMIVEFRAIGDKSVEEALRGSECTAAYLYEADQLSQAVFSFMSGRIGRYSRGFDLASIVDPQIFADTNAFDVDNWLYELAVDQSLDEAAEKTLAAVLQGRRLIEFFQQPAAIDKDGNVNPAAENLQNLRPGYYEAQYLLNRHRKNYVDRMLKNKLVPLQHGQPVYGDEFDPEEHIAPGRLEADPSRRLTIGLDAGLTPAAVGGQRTSLGELRVLFELAVFAEGEDMIGKVGATRFAQALRAYLLEHYPHHYRPVERAGRAADRGRLRGALGRDGRPLTDDHGDDRIRFVCDPSAKDGTDKSGNEESWLEIVQAILGYPLRPAKTNKLNVRLEAVRLGLMRRGGFVMSRGCKILRKGFVAGYHYVRVAVGDSTTGRFASEPSKNQFSHSHDALQYLAMDDEDTLAEVLGKAKRGSRAGQGRVDLGEGYFSGGRAA